MITERDIEAVKSKVEPILGQKPWNVSLGNGSFLTMNFGREVSFKSKVDTKGEWYLWVYCCAWRLEKNDRVLAASEDSRSKLEAAIKTLEDLSVQSIELLKPAWDTVFTFDEGIILRLLTIHSEAYEHWMLFMPDNYVLIIGPGTEWTCVQEIDER